MTPSDKNKEPVIESSPAAERADATVQALRQRIRQQEILSELGVNALQGDSLEKLLKDTARLTADGLKAEFCKVLEHIAAENCFLVRAGVGWKPGIVGVAKIGAGLDSPAGFALRTGKPVISNHLAKEARFKTPSLLLRHGIHRAMNVILQGDGRPFGVLEVDRRHEDEFVEHDLAFLQGVANLLGMAIERDRHERNLQAALERQEFLRKEMSHRVKNSLAIVVSMLRLQSREIGDPTFAGHLEEAARRVAAIAQAHEQLHRASDAESMDVGKYIEDVCKNLDQSIGQCEVLVEAEHGVAISTDRAISSALAVNELIANAVKYAYRDVAAGRIWVRVKGVANDRFRISVRDEGAGLPAGFEIGKAEGLGMRIVLALVEQIGGAFDWSEQHPGTEFTITAPRAASG
jgi:two-component sensor histidine kinase